MNEFDDFDDLERDVGPALRVALRRIADEITDDGRTTPARASHHAQDGVAIVDLETSAATTVRRRRRPRLMAAAVLSAAAVVVVAVAAVTIARRGDGTPAGRPTEAVAESFMKAWVRGDGDAVAALMSPDGSVDVWTADTLPALHDWYRAVRSQYRDEGCAVTSRDSVSCDYTFTNALTRVVGTQPVAGTFLLVIDGGVVRRVGDEINTATYQDV